MGMSNRDRLQRPSLTQAMRHGVHDGSGYRVETFFLRKRIISGHHARRPIQEIEFEKSGRRRGPNQYLMFHNGSS